MVLCNGHRGKETYAFTVCRSLEENSKDNEVTMWSLVSLATTNVDSNSVLTFKPPLKTIINLTSNVDGEWLCLAGKDFQMRDVIIVYQMDELIKGKQELFARQLFDFDMYTSSFHAVVPNQIVAAGKETIKLFKIKNGCLPGQSVALNNTARGKFFTKIAFQGPVEKGNGYTYVASSDGLLYVVNTVTRQIDKVI